MTKLQPVRGTHDILPEENRQRRFVAGTARDIAARFGYGEITPPIFEFTDVFHRTLGDTSDVVTKETYSFTDRGGESITLRPELTASIARIFISEGMQDKLPLKFFYHGPAFRYERPQKGRMRQFHQIGVELLGVAEPQGDIETIAMASQIFETLGLKEKVTLELNSLGDPESRANYRNALVNYFNAHKDKLSEDSRNRLEKNPLRILDSKDEGDRALIAGAPKIDEHFTPAAKEFFTAVQQGLTSLNIPFHVNDKLVRGLDYYNHTVFEFTSTALGAQNTLLAGGRYDSLISTMGGPETAGVGWAAGVERLLLAVDFASLPAFTPVHRPIVIIPVGEAQETEALKVMHYLRSKGFTIEDTYRGNVGKRMKRADKYKAKLAIIFGEEELKRGCVQLKLLDSGEQKEIALSDLELTLSAYKDQ